MLARLTPREIHADVNAGFTLVECNREIDEREAKAEDLTPNITISLFMYFSAILILDPSYSSNL